MTRGWAKGAALAPVIPALLLAFSGGPPARHSGAPGDQTCAKAGCHAGTPNPDASGRLALQFPSASAYTPGMRQRLRVTLSHPQARRWGFQLTARLASNERGGQAGSFAPVDGSTWVICENDTPRGGGACPAAAPLEFIEHFDGGTRRGTTGSSSWEVDWTPPASAAGDVVFHLAGNAANGDSFPTGDRIYTAKFTVTGPPVAPPRPSISSNGVVNGASFRAGISPGSWFAIQGANLAPSTRTATGLVAELDGVRVSVNNKPALLYYISPAQINAIVPNDDSVGPVAVQVTTAAGASDPVTATLQKFAPALFLFDGKRAAATHADGSPIGPGSPARAEEVIILYGTGFGATTPFAAAGSPAEGIARLNEPVTMRVDAVAVEVLYAGLAPGFAGLYQFNVKLPEAPRAGDAEVTVEIGGIQSPPGVLLAIQR